MKPHRYALGLIALGSALFALVVVTGLTAAADSKPGRTPVPGVKGVGVFTVPIIPDGRGAVGSYRRWDAPTFPAVTDDRRRLGG